MADRTAERRSHLGLITIGLVVLLLVGLVLTWWFLLEGPRRAQNRSIALIEGWGGTVDSRSSCPLWLHPYVRETFVEEYWRRVVDIELAHRTPIPQGQTNYLAPFRRLRSLKLHFGANDSQPVLGHIPQNDYLERLLLASTNTIPLAERVPHLRSLELIRGRVEYSDGQCLAEYDELVRLYLVEWSQPTEPILAQVGGMKSLRTLVIRDCPATSDTALSGIGEATTLTELGIQTSAGFGSVGVEKLSGLSALETLAIVGTDIEFDESAIRAIGNMSELRWLSLWGTRFDDEDAVVLTGLTNLEVLRLSQTEITEDAVPLLRSMPALETLHILGVPFSDEGARLLKDSIPIVELDELLTLEAY